MGGEEEAPADGDDEFVGEERPERPQGPPAELAQRPHKEDGEAPADGEERPERPQRPAPLGDADEDVLYLQKPPRGADAFEPAPILKERKERPAPELKQRRPAPELKQRRPAPTELRQQRH